jgi:hypothetical protein
MVSEISMYSERQNLEEISFFRPVVVYTPGLKVENGSAFRTAIQIFHNTPRELAARRPIYPWRNFRPHCAGFSNLLMEENDLRLSLIIRRVNVK